MNRHVFPNKLRTSFYYALVMVLTFSCVLPGLTTPKPQPTPTAYQEPLPPTLVEVSPLDGSMLGMDQPITFYFNQAMDRDSVDTALFGLPPGSLIWGDDSTLTFTPNPSLEAETEITVAILTSAKAANGLGFVEPVTLTFHTPDLLRPVSVLPKPATQDVDPNAAVAVTFNQPVVSLGAEDGLPDALSLEPDVAGSGEWLSTSTYVFHPDPALAGGVTYTTRLNTDLVSASGSRLDMGGSSVAWSFETASPRLVSVSPSNEAPLSLTPSFTLTFNQAMDTASVENNFSFCSPSASVGGLFTWNDDHTALTYEPATPLSRSTNYILSIAKDAKGMGGTPLTLEQQFVYSTYGDFKFNSSDPQDGGIKADNSSLRLFFSAPPKDVTNLEDFLSISPSVPNFGVSVNGTALNLYGAFGFEVAYTLWVSPNLVDEWGQPLGQPITIKFNTPAATPSLSLPYLGDVLLVRPDEPALMANATNIKSAQVTVDPLSLDSFLYLNGPANYDERQGYTPKNPSTFTSTYNLQPSRNEVISLPLAKTGDTLTPGTYFVRITSPQLIYGREPFVQDLNVSAHQGGGRTVQTFFVASYVNLTFKTGPTDALVWATDLRTEQPLTEAPVTVYDGQGNLLASGQTDAWGLWQTEFDQPDNQLQTLTAVVGEPGQEIFGLATSSWNTGVSPWEFGLSTNRTAPHLDAYLYTDRPIYRPGQTVYFRGVLRQAFNGRYALPDATSILLELRDTNDLTLQTFDLPLSPYGTFDGEFRLSSEAAPGSYRLFNDDLNAYIYFTVAEYRKPEIELSVAFGKDQFKYGEQAQAESDANYYFGAPARNVDVQWSLYARSTNFYLPGYQTGIYDDSWLQPYWSRGLNYGHMLESGTARTEPDGSLLLPFSPIPPSDLTQALTLELTATDESGLPVSARAEALVHPADFYIGLRPDQWVGQSGRALGFDVLTADWDKNASPSHTLQAEFKQVTWERSVPNPDNLFDTPVFTPVYTPVGSSNLATGTDGKARLSFTPKDPGTYMLEVYGGGAKTQVLVWVTGGQNAAWPDLTNDQVHLTADQDAYKPGQTADVFIPNPFGEPVSALVTVERGLVMDAKVLTLSASGSTYSLPLTDEHAPNVYISATLLGPGNSFRQGYVNLTVEPVSQELRVELTAQPEINQPRGKMTVQVRVTDSSGNPVEGEFSLSVVDKAVLALADPNSQDILTAFYGNQSLGVDTGTSLAVYSGRSLASPPGGLGGGGGGEVTTVREQFPDTAYWNPTFLTDSNGTAQVTIMLPDSLTTWVIESRGLTTDTRVGQAETEAVTTKSLLVRPVTPRFLIVGDHVELAAIVHNNTYNDMQASVSIQATGFTLDDANQTDQTVDVPANGRARVSWWGTADQADSADLTFSVRGSSSGQTLQDAAKPALGALPIYSYLAPQTFVTSGMLMDSGAVQEVVSLPRTFSPTRGGLDVELSPSLAASLLKSLEALPTPLCTCNSEAVLSYFLPNVETYHALHISGMDDPGLHGRLDASLNDGLAALLRNQNYDGGWGWMRDGNSDPYISAYVLFGLARVREAGFNVPSRVFENGQSFLRDALLSALPDSPQDWELDRLAFAAFAVQQSGGVQDSDAMLLNQLYERRDRLSPWAGALLALSLEAVSPNDARANDLISNLEATAVRTGSSANWEAETGTWHNPGTPLYTTAVVAYALAQRDPASPVLIDAVRYLSAHRDARGLWPSSYESAWVMLALTEAMQGFGELQADFSFSADVNGAMLANGQVSGTDILTPVTASVPLEYLSATSPNALTISRETGLGRLYYRASLQIYRPVETVQPLNKGLDISRAYYDGACVDDAAQSPSKICLPLSKLQLATGSKLITRLTLTLPHDAYYVMLEDFIPAGTELLDQALKTSQQGQDATDVQAVYDAKDPFAQGWGWWYFNQPHIRDNTILWSANYLPAGTYELTYTLIPTQAGQFRVLPAHAWQAFFPDVQGTSGGTIFEITP